MLMGGGSAPALAYAHIVVGGGHVAGLLNGFLSAL